MMVSAGRRPRSSSPLRVVTNHTSCRRRSSWGCPHRGGARAGRVAAGGEWRHLFRETSRLKRGAVNGERVVDPKLESWAEGTSAFLTDQYAATLELAKLWSGPGGTRSLSLRWVEGLQDLLPSPDAEIHHHALQLVAGWER